MSPHKAEAQQRRGERERRREVAGGWLGVQPYPKAGYVVPTSFTFRPFLSHLSLPLTMLPRDRANC